MKKKIDLVMDKIVADEDFENQTQQWKHMNQ